jgi:DNA-binding CsgD family transcriptional regulator
MRSLLRNDETRFRVAYLKINNGLALKEIAATLGLHPKTAEYYWATSQAIIRGKKLASLRQLR